MGGGFHERSLNFAKSLEDADFLELFAPVRPIPRSTRAEHLSKSTALWRRDALHRTKNLAQMALSLSHLVEHDPRRRLPLDAVTEARGLARLYDELGVDDDNTCELPCAAILADIVTRMIALFGNGGRITARLSIDNL